MLISGGSLILVVVKSDNVLTREMNTIFHTSANDKGTYDKSDDGFKRQDEDTLV